MAMRIRADQISEIIRSQILPADLSGSDGHDLKSPNNSESKPRTVSPLQKTTVTTDADLGQISTRTPLSGIDG